MDSIEEKRRRYAKFHEEMDAKLARPEPGKYLFDLKGMEKLVPGPAYSSGAGPCVKGERVQIVLCEKERGTGARLHAHPNEAFNFVVKGRLVFKIGDLEGVAEEGQAIYVPPNVPHYVRATETEDLVYLVVKDTSYYIAGEPVDASHEGAYYAPGFEPKSE